MNRTSIRRLVVLAITGLALTGCVSTAVQDTADDEIVRGREQLIRAFDAAWIRIVASGKDLEILATEPTTRPGAALDYMVRLVDCLPLPETAAWPEEPVGLFREILDRGTIRGVVQSVPVSPDNTAFYFSGISEKYQQAMLEEIGKHYGVDLQFEPVAAPPGPLPSTSALLDGNADFVTQLNATGGETQGMRRKVSRRYSCTMSASSQYVHIPESSPLASEIRNFRDVMARPELRICAGPLTTQTARAFLPGHTVKTRYVNDLSGCAEDVAAGKADIIMNPLPDLAIGGIKGYRSTPTMIVAGTPLWVAKEGIECPSDGNPRTEDQCFEISPP